MRKNSETLLQKLDVHIKHKNHKNRDMLLHLSRSKIITNIYWTGAQLEKKQRQKKRPQESKATRVIMEVLHMTHGKSVEVEKTTLDTHTVDGAAGLWFQPNWSRSTSDNRRAIRSMWTHPPTPSYSHYRTDRETGNPLQSHGPSQTTITSHNTPAQAVTTRTVITHTHILYLLICIYHDRINKNSESSVDMNQKSQTLQWSSHRVWKTGGK